VNQSVTPKGVRPLLFFSGLCALVYQVTWTRELRLIFGASSASSAAVLGVFMGGLGVGGLVLGARVESKAAPLRYYANLEIAVAVSAACTPLVLRLVRFVYLAAGGQATLGPVGATLVRLLLSAIVLGVPTFLMGGTLPAAARAVAERGDAGRRAVAALYAANTFGAVAGACLADFVMLEIVGNRLTLWIACLVNALVGMLARALARRARKPPAERDEASAEASVDRLQTRVAFAVAGAAGFGFFALELVWYRLLAPLLGGSSYTFGLILAVALLGIAVGGALYTRRPREVPADLGQLAKVTACEALAVALPFALGDRVAEIALLSRPFGAFGFYGHVASWALVASIVVLPAAIVAGYQFPLLIALLGRTREGVARDVGRAYAWNTAGSIAGSILAGFVLLPRLGAERCWTGAVVLFALLAFAAVAVANRTRGGSVRDVVTATAVAAAALIALRADGPTAAWRHSPIGAGRLDYKVAGMTRNGIRSWLRTTRREIVWQQDGVESSIAARVVDDYAFLVNGRADGSARTDAGTQVMSGLIGAALLPNAKSALVVGLGTGCTAGWLAKVPGMERVDVVELEPAMVRVARELAPVNQDVMDAPNVHVTFDDAREVLQTTRRRYDVIFSEPSNPYRAGISSLYTRDFYEAVRSRLRPGGVFAQWLQVYAVDGFTVRTAITTLHAVFPHVTLWETTRGDIVMTATTEVLAPSLSDVRERVAREPFRTAMRVTWGVEGVEGLLAHHLAAPALANAIAKTGAINTDDLNLLEYSFARDIGKEQLREDDELWAVATRAQADLPAWARGVDLLEVERRRLIAGRAAGARLTPELRALQGVIERYQAGDLAAAASALAKTKVVPEAPFETVMVADIEAHAGAADASAAIDRVRAFAPSDARALDAELAWAGRDDGAAVDALEAAFTGWRHDPWATTDVRDRAIDLAVTIATAKHAHARRLFDALGVGFAAHGGDERRRSARLTLAQILDGATGTSCREALRAYEPSTPWSRTFLRDRVACYERAPRDPLAARAESDLAEFESAAPAPLSN
jgi:spermidine synthase